MSVMARMAGILEGGLGDKRLIQALSIGKNNLQTLVNIANGAPPQNGVDSMYATMALNILGPALKAQKAREAGQQPPQSTVKDQVVADAQQSAPENVGIAALPQTESVMPEQAMAAGGIVAFQEGGTTSSPLGRAVSGMFEPPVEAAAYQAGKRGYDARINQIQTRLNQLAGTFGLRQQTKEEQQEYTQLKAELNRLLAQKLSLYPDIQRAMTYQPPAAPTAPTAPTAPAAPTAGADQAQQERQQQQRQQPPGAGGGVGGSSLAGFPAVSPSLKAVEAALKARGEFDPFASYSTFDPTQYPGLLPMTPEKLREERAPAATKLKGMFPQTREEAEAEIAKRYAGLEEMYKQREARAGEAREEAEAEKGRTAGLGLMQLASELVTKPLTKIDTSAAFQTFKDANTDFRKAQKEYREGLDKIAEARELQKIGQYEQADKLFREGAMAEFNFANETDKLAVAQDAVYKTGVRSLFNTKTEAQAATLDANLDAAKLQLSTAVEGQKLRSEQDVANIYAGSRGVSGRSSLEDKAQDNARAALQQYLEANPLIKAQSLKNPELIRELQNRFYFEELAKLQGTVAPSGGGASRAGAFTVEKLPAK